MKKNYQSYLVLSCLLILGSIFIYTTKISKLTENVSNSEAGNNWSTKKTKIKTGKEAFMKPDGFIEYYNSISKKIGERSSQYVSGYKFSELSKSLKRASQSRIVNLDANFISRGPGNVGGRTRAIAIDSEDSSNCTWFVGAASGGIWKTTDCGDTWENISPDVPNLSTNSIAQSVSNPDVIYVGTGEVFAGNATFVRGDGIYKSEDKGASWNLLPATIDNDLFESVNRIKIDPSNQDIVVIATNEGIFKSLDGGTSWNEQGSFINQNGFVASVQDLQVDPNDFNTQYAGVDGVGIVKSTDAGDTWMLSSEGINASERFEVAVAPSNPDFVYTSTFERLPGGETPTVVYVSRDKGETWFRVNSQEGFNDSFLGNQGWYDNSIAVNPYNENEVFVGGVSIGKYIVDPVLSTEAGVTTASSTTSAIYDAYGAYQNQNINSLHPDHHNLTFLKMDDATETFMVVNGNDGGFGFSENNGIDFVEKESGYVTSQFYGADKKPGEDKYVGGMQDNGTYVSSGSTVDATNEYDFRIGGDGFEVIWHATDPQKVIGGSQFNGISRSTNGGASFSRATTGITDGPFITRLAGSVSSPDVIYALGSTGVYKSTNFGQSWTMKTINDDRWDTRNVSATDVEVSLANDQIVWAGAGMAEGVINLFVSTDAGETYGAVNNYDPNPQAFYTGIYTHPTDENTAYALFSRANFPKILKTTDLGQTWTDISGFEGNDNGSDRGFPDVFTHSLLVMPFNTDIIWAGTEIGLYESLDGGLSWNIRNDIPSVSIWSMKIVDDQVVLGTHGRGIWTATIDQLKKLNLAINSFSYLGFGDAEVSVDLPVNYDKVKVLVDGIELGMVDAPESGALTIPISGYQSFNGTAISIVGLINGEEFASQKFRTGRLNVAPEILSYGSSSRVEGNLYPVTIEMENNEPFDKVEVYFGEELVFTDNESLSRSVDVRTINFDYDKLAENSVLIKSYINDIVYTSIGSDGVLITSNESVIEKSMRIYPNPTSDYVSISSDAFSVSKVNIFDASGVQVKKFDLNKNTENTQIDLSSLNQGVYLIQITSESGKILSKRIIKN